MNRNFIGSILIFLMVIGCSESLYDDDTSKESSFSELTGDGSGSGNGGNDTLQSGQITAGEWNDLKNWSFWINLQQHSEFNEATKNWTFFPFQRFCFLVTNNNQKPVMNCRIKLKQNQSMVWEAVTDNHGMAELWFQLFQKEPSIPQLSATIQYNTYTSELENISGFSSDTNRVILPFQTQIPSQVDIHFMVDATGSMGDELEYLKVELNDVISRLNTQYPNLQFRYGSVFYRDNGDEYLTRIKSFTTEKNELVEFIKNQYANGGGDYPEAVHEALSVSVFNQDWGKENRASLCFLLLDAPPHSDAPIISSINQTTQAAAAKGIKLIPITASGIDHSTEFLMRSMALATNGTYIFITNHSGIGGEHLEPTVGEYHVEFLNQLLIRIIGEAIE